MIQVFGAVMAVIIVSAAMLVGVGSGVPDAVARIQTTAQGAVGYAALREALDAYGIANRGATTSPGLGPDGNPLGDLAAYLPVPPRMPNGIAWSVAGGTAPTACAWGLAPTRAQREGLARLAARFGGTAGPSCGSAQADPAADGPYAATMPLWRG